MGLFSLPCGLLFSMLSTYTKVTSSPLGQLVLSSLQAQQPANNAASQLESGTIKRKQWIPWWIPFETFKTASTNASSSQVLVVNIFFVHLTLKNSTPKTIHSIVLAGTLTLNIHTLCVASEKAGPKVSWHIISKAHD